MPAVVLRPLTDADLPSLFRMMQDEESVRMAAFVPADYADREHFEAKLNRLRTDPEVTYRAITVDGALAGSISAFVMEGDTEITYWIDRPFWGRGTASAALTLFLEVFPRRPIFARVAADNAASRRVLTKSGFRPVGTELSYAPARRTDIEELVLRLE